MNNRLNARRRYSAAVLLLVCHGSMEAQAAEFGNITVHSWIGRQLKASVQLVGEDARESEARCFKASVAGLNREAASPLKVSLQHSPRSSVLLLTGGSAVDEPAATVAVENVCGTGTKREYAVLLDLVPEAVAIASAPVPVTPESSEQPAKGRESTARGNPDPASRADAVKSKPVRATRDDRALDTSFISRIGGLLNLKMAAVIHQPQGEGLFRAAYASADRFGEAAQTGDAPGALLKLERSLSTKAGSGGDSGQSSLNGVVAVILSVLAALGAAAWVAMRVRAMRAAHKPWAPIDAMLDADAKEGRRGKDTAELSG